MVEIRKAKSSDAKVAWELRKEAINWQGAGSYSKIQLEVWTAGDLTEEYAELVERYFYVLELDGQVVATGMLGWETGKLDAVFVKPVQMAKGYGRMMLNHLESIAIERGLNELMLDSTLNAAAFYRKNGFIGEEVSVYHSPRGVSLACIPMKKNIVTEA